MAGKLFYERGYTGTSLKDVAEVLGITAPAIYRHFSGKQDLLRAALDSALDAPEAVIQADAIEHFDLHEAIRRLTVAAVARPETWKLAERDARHLGAADQERIADRIGSVGRWLRDKIASSRPELDRSGTSHLARAVLAMLTMPSAYASRIAPDELVRIMSRTAEHAIQTPVHLLVPTDTLSSLDAGNLDLSSRREGVLREAARLFSENGYASVSISDIGEAVGMTGPSLYYYFDSKADILTSIFLRGLEWLAIDRARHAQADERAALRVLLESYARLALSWQDIFRLFVNEQVALRFIDNGSAVRAYRDVVQDGLALLRTCRPELTRSQARALFGCAMSVINDLAITRADHDPQASATVLVAVAFSMLDTDLGVKTTRARRA